MIKDLSKKAKLTIAIIIYDFTYDMLDNEYGFSKNGINKEEFIDEIIKRELNTKLTKEV